MATVRDRAIEDGMIKVIENWYRCQGVSQLRIAKEMGVSRTSIYHWESGMAWPKDLARLKQLCRATGGKLEIKLIGPYGKETLF